MQYYIEISPWNLLESFVTESISPYSFYESRNFGNNLSRYLSGEKEKFNYLILSTEDLGGDISLIVDEELIDITILRPIKNLKSAFTYPKTIYYRKGYVHFRIESDSIKNSIISESQILLEVKCLEKYLPDFFINNKKDKTRKGIARYKETFSFEKQSYVEFDNRLNKIKGAIIGYTRGLFTTSDQTNLQMQNELRDLKNAFAGLNTKIMMNDVFNAETNIYEKINKCKGLYIKSVEHTNSFDVLVDLYHEILKLAKMRSEEIQQQKLSFRKDEILREKTKIEDDIEQIELRYNISEVRRELDNIKASERRNGEAIGKTRLYYKKDSAEYARKKYLKSVIDDFENYNEEFKQLQSRLCKIEEELNTDANKYDATLSAIFIRISDILNDVIKSSSNTVCQNNVDLSQIRVSLNAVHMDCQQEDAELCYLNILLKCIIDNTNVKKLSEHFVLQLLEESAKEFKETELANSDSGIKIINTLREYWLYKNQRAEEFCIPSDMPILQSIMSFFVKPLGFDQIERYMMMKKYTHKAYAFMLWGAWIGFADMPKTFTNILYQNEHVNFMVENELKKIC